MTSLKKKVASWKNLPQWMCFSNRFISFAAADPCLEWADKCPSLPSYNRIGKGPVYERAYIPGGSFSMGECQIYHLIYRMPYAGLLPTAYLLVEYWLDKRTIESSLQQLARRRPFFHAFGRRRFSPERIVDETEKNERRSYSFPSPLTCPY